MKLAVIAIGRMKAGPERELAERYQSRAAESGRAIGIRGLDTHELSESRARDAATRMNEEAAAIAPLLPERGRLIVLDERGKNIASADLATFLGRERDAGAPATTFIIGGADGVAPELRAKADLVLAFGAATWPHQFARVMLYEQIYRAITILSGHPYHRV